jgi:hypothetical protein
MACNIYVKKTATGWTVEAHKSHGINKGVTVLATTCGGMMGKRLAMTIALWSCKDLMADDIIAPDYEEEAA